MKIIIPFDQSELFTTDQQALLGDLQLDVAFIVDQALSSWTLYAYGSAADMYEHTVDTIYEEIYRRNMHDKHAVARLENVLSQNADELTQLISHMAIVLKQLLEDIPDEIIRQSLNDDVYHYLRVEEINVMGRFAKLASNSLPMHA